MIGGFVKGQLEKLGRPLFEGLYRMGISPNLLTFTGLGLSLLASALLWMGSFRVAGLFMLAGGLCDMLDGGGGKGPRAGEPSWGLSGLHSGSLFGPVPTYGSDALFCRTGERGSGGTVLPGHDWDISCALCPGQGRVLFAQMHRGLDGETRAHLGAGSRSPFPGNGLGCWDSGPTGQSDGPAEDPLLLERAAKGGRLNSIGGARQ